MRTTYPCSSIWCTCKMYVRTSVVITFALPVILTNIFSFARLEIYVCECHRSFLLELASRNDDAFICMCFMSLNLLSSRLLYTRKYVYFFYSCSRTTTTTNHKKTNQQHWRQATEVRKKGKDSRRRHHVRVNKKRVFQNLIVHSLSLYLLLLLFCFFFYVFQFHFFLLFCGVHDQTTLVVCAKKCG